mmetsp:Transcript_25159/g.83066  ORF Transcript_25159/g.83066 Transcript_25159/m.83066 type:complete len:281 (+) Transcript_25159:391-1233(+)
MHDFLVNVLVNKPEDCFQFCNEYFESFKGGDGSGDAVDGWGYARARPLLLVGPPESGKRGLARDMVKAHIDKFGVLVAFTDRELKEKEKEGVDFQTMDRGSFSIAAGADEFIVEQEIGESHYGWKHSNLESIFETGRCALIPCPYSCFSSFRTALAGKFMPRCVLIKPEVEALKRRQQEKGLSNEEIEKRANETMNMYAEIEKKVGLFEKEFVVEYDQTSISRKSAEQIVEWTLSIDWELKLDKDLSHAATKIQGQARRRRDARRVKKLKEESKSKESSE